MAKPSALRTLAADDPTLLPGLMPRNVKLVRDQVNALYLKHRSGREVARVIGIEWRTLKRWLLRFAVQGIPIPEESKGDYLTRSKLKKSREKAQEKASKKKGVA